MSEVLIIIDRLIQEHAAIKGHMKSASESAEDWRGMEWDNLINLTHEQLQTLNNKRFNLKQMIGDLHEGMKNHGEYEEKILPGLIGEPLMKSIVIEHQEIQKQMREINFVLDKSTPQEFLSNRAYLMHIISYLSQLISEHELKEDTILQLFRKQFI